MITIIYRIYSTYNIINALIKDLIKQAKEYKVYVNIYFYINNFLNYITNRFF